MKQKKLDILNKILFVFLLLQPFFDIYMSLVGEKLDIFGMSIVTILRTTSIVTLFATVIVYQLKNKENIKMIYLISSYLIFVLLYIIMHHLNIVNSGGYYISQGIYNVITEILYVERLVVPVLLLYIAIIIKPDIKQMIKVIIYTSLIISVVIIITNIFKISFASYSTTGSPIVSYNIFDWFKDIEIGYIESLSKGWFVSANQIGALLVVLLPFTIYEVLKENKTYAYITFFSQIVALNLIGTRVASFGWILVCLAMTVVYILLFFMKKARKITIQNISNIIIIIAIGVLIFLNSPAHNRDFDYEYKEIYEEEIIEKIEEGTYIEFSEFLTMLNDEKIIKEYVLEDISDKGLKYDAMCKYISQNHRCNGITKKYVYQIYPYEDDPEFWIDMFSLPTNIKLDNRYKQIEIIKRIKQRNNNIFFDTVLGMGATPMNSREYMIENDIKSHYYNLGVLGVLIFITPYIACVIYAIAKMKNSIYQLFDLTFITTVLSLCIAYCLGFFAGHVLDEYIVTLYLAPIAATIVNLYKEGVIINES